MEINTEKYGSTGLPKFGPGYSIGGLPAVGGATSAGAPIEEVNAAFNNLTAVVKKHCIAGNSMALWFFGYTLKGLYGLAYSVVAEKPVTNA